MFGGHRRITVLSHVLFISQFCVYDKVLVLAYASLVSVDHWLSCGWQALQHLMTHDIVYYAKSIMPSNFWFAPFENAGRTGVGDDYGDDLGYHVHGDLGYHFHGDDLLDHSHITHLSCACPELVFGLSSACLSLVFSLSLACRQPVFSLSSSCILLVFILYFACLQLVFSLSLACLRLVFKLSLACRQPLFGLSSACL